MKITLADAARINSLLGMGLGVTLEFIPGGSDQGVIVGVTRDLSGTGRYELCENDEGDTLERALDSLLKQVRSAA